MSLVQFLEAAIKKAPQKGAFVVFDGCYIKTVILIFLPFQITGRRATSVVRRAEQGTLNVVA